MVNALLYANIYKEVSKMLFIYIGLIAIGVTAILNEQKLIEFEQNIKNIFKGVRKWSIF